MGPLPMSRSRKSFIHRYRDGGDLCAGHAREVQEMRGRVDDGNVHVDADFAGLSFGGGYGDARAGQGEGFAGLGRHCVLVWLGRREVEERRGAVRLE